MIYPFQVLRTEGGLTPKVREAFFERYGKRGADAFDAALAHKVKKYRDYYVVVGNHDEYVWKTGFAVVRRHCMIVNAGTRWPLKSR
jgi:hypothetical protein